MSKFKKQVSENQKLNRDSIVPVQEHIKALQEQRTKEKEEGKTRRH